MSKIVCKKLFLLLSMFVALAIIAVAQEKDKESNEPLLKVSRTENTPGAFEDNFSLGHLANKITKNKLKENADIVKKLNDKKQTNSKDAKRIKKNLKDLHSNPERYNKRNKKTSKSGTHSQKAYAEAELRNNRQQSKKTNQQHADATKKSQNIKKGQQKYNKATKLIGTVGKIIAVYDSYQNAYVITDGKKVFSYTKFGTNAALNLTGIAGLISMYEKGMGAKEEEYLQYLDQFEKEGRDITDPAVINEALFKATGKALLVGAYEGAKCLPLAGDAINVYELTEASVGLVHDTLQSQKIREENKNEQDRQAEASAAGLKAYVRKAKLCREMFEKQNKQALELFRQFKKLKNQYTVIENRSVARDKKLVDGDKLEKDCKIAKPFMDAKYLASLKDNSKQLDQAVRVTLKLAETTLQNYQANGGDTTPLNKTSKELSDMLKDMTAYKVECDKIVKVLNPLTGGPVIMNTSQALGEEANADAIMSNQLMINANDLVKLHRSISAKCKKLQTAQKLTRESFDKAYDYFSSRAKTDLSGLKNEIIGDMIKDYELKKLNDNTKSLSADLRYWHKPIKPAEGMSPEVTELLAKAAVVGLEISELQGILDARIMAVKSMIQQLRNPATKEKPKYEVASKLPKLSDKEFGNITAKKICELSSNLHYVKSKMELNREACGFKFYKNNLKEFQANIANPNVKSIPYSIGSLRKLLEKGTTLVWLDLNKNGIKENNEWRKEPYWIWYETIHGCSVYMQWYYWDEYYADREMKREKEGKHKGSTLKIHPFTAPNVKKGFIKIEDGKGLSYDKRPYTYRHYTGFAMYPPFKTNVHLRVIAQFGPYSHYTGTTFADSKMQTWQYLKDPSHIQTRLVFWEKGIKKQIKEMLNETLTLPKQYMDYTEKRYYKRNTTDFFPKSLNGFSANDQERGQNQGTLRRYFKKKWILNGSKRTGRLNYTTEIFAYYPKNDQSWNDFIKHLPEKIAREKNNSTVSIKGADAVRASKRVSTSSYTIRPNKQKITIYSVTEDIHCIKSNVIIEVSGHGCGLPSQSIDSQAIMQNILNNMKK